MADSTRAIKAALWAFLAFAFASWILSIIGLAGLQRQCYFQPSIGQVFGNAGSTVSQQSYFGSDLPFVGIRGLNRSYGCERIYSYYWFMLAMQLVALLGLTILSCMRLLAASGLSWLAWLTVLTALFIQGSDTFLALKDNSGLFGDTYRYARLSSVGWILTSLCNLAIIFILGWRPRRVASNSGGGKY